MMWIGLFPFTLVMSSESHEESNRRAEARKRRREELEQETQDTV